MVISKKKTKYKSKLKTVSMNIINGSQIRIFNEMTTYSKNICNITIYCHMILKYYDIHIYRDLCSAFEQNNNININTELYNIYNKYHALYSKNIELRKINNEIIYKYIKEHLTEFVENKNLLQLKTKFRNELDRLVKYDDSNKHFVFEEIVDSIINSYYNKNYYYTKDCLLHIKPINHGHEEFIKCVRDNKCLVVYPQNVYKPKFR